MEFGSILFHKMSKEFSDKDKKTLIEKLNIVLLEFDAEFDEYEFSSFPSKEYPISKCIRCGYLTLNTKVNPEGFDSGDIFDAISRVVHKGECKNGEYLCYECLKIGNS